MFMQFILVFCILMDCKHGFKNTTRFFCVHSPFEKYCTVFFETISKKSNNSNFFFIRVIRIRKITQIIINMPNYFFLNVSTLF